jgi:hypothetical protein
VNESVKVGVDGMAVAVREIKVDSGVCVVTGPQAVIKSKATTIDR